MRLIDADKLKADVVSWENCYNGFSDTYDKAMIIDTIDEQPAIDAVPVRRGRWIPVKGYEGILYKCSACDGRWSHTTIKTPYCSQCGAKMEGERRADEGTNE